MLRVFFEVVLPVALVAVFGGAVGRWRKVPVAPISSLVFYLFSPVLVFQAMATTEVSANVSVKIVGVMLVTFLVMYAAATLWSLLRHHDPAMRAAFALGATTPNVGNMGLPVAQLAFGPAGLQIAVMNFVAGAVLVNSASIAIASLAGGMRLSSLTAPFRYPALYASAAGILVNVLNVDLPVTIEAPINQLASAAIPVMLVVLGLQLQHAGGTEDIFDTVVVNIAKLVIAPCAAWLSGTALGLEGTALHTLVVLAAMPTAVSAIILATEFRAKPNFVTRVVVSSTLLCMVSLTLLITLIR